MQWLLVVKLFACLFVTVYFQVPLLPPLFPGIMCEFCVKAITTILPASVKGFFYHSAIVLILSVIIGR